MHSHEISVLEFLKSIKGASTLELIVEGTKLNRDTVIWALENLLDSGHISLERSEYQQIRLTDEGISYLKEFPEENTVKEIDSKGGKLEAGKIKNNVGLSWAKRNGWITIDKGVAVLTKEGKEIARSNNYQKRVLFNELRSSRDKDKTNQLIKKNIEEIKELENRNLIELKEIREIKTVSINQKGIEALRALGKEINGKVGINTSVAASSEISQLTGEMIKTGSWKGKRFRSYDIKAGTEATYPSRLHPIHEYVDIIRNIWISMGFKDVHGPIVESAFRNFDALFSPQDHPTRDMHDTFFLSNPGKMELEDDELVNGIKRMHQKAWKEKWIRKIAEQPVLRTHATSTTYRYIRKLANSNEQDYPIKVISIGRVFRNESVDYKHLAELIHCDGIIMGKNLTISNLIYTLKSFFRELDIEVHIKPSYFPFVEPGIELHYYDQNRNDMIELAGAGVVRKEITKAMGTKMSVLAWGMGIERQILKKLDLENISMLYKNEIGWLRNRKEIEGI